MDPQAEEAGEDEEADFAAVPDIWAGGYPAWRPDYGGTKRLLWSSCCAQGRGGEGRQVRRCHDGQRSPF